MGDDDGELGVSVKQRNGFLHMPLSSVPWITVDSGPPLSSRLTRQVAYYPNE